MEWLLVSPPDIYAAGLQKAVQSIYLPEYWAVEAIFKLL